jgi:prefoldin subunit 5
MIAYNDFIKRLEVDAEMLGKNIDNIDADINEMKKREEEYMVRVDRPGAGTKEGVLGGDRSAYLNMLYLKSIDRQKDLSNSWESLRTIQRQLTMHQITLGNLEDYKTEVVSEIKSTATVESKEEKNNAIAVAGVVGLIMSLFIAFFMEYIEESKSRRKGK